MISMALAIVEFALRALLVTSCIAAAAGMGLFLLRNRPATQRVWLMRAAVVACFVALVAAWPGWYEPLPLQIDSEVRILPDGTRVEETVASHLLIPLRIVAAIAGALLAGWIVGALRLAGGYARMNRMRTRARATKLSDVYESPTLSLPITVGISHSVILLPAHALRRGGLSSVLAHERAHVEARDPAWLTLVALLRSVLFVHPAIHWLGRRLELEQELAADESVVGAGHPARGYAHELLDWAEGSYRMPALVIAAKASPTQLERRLHWLLRRRRPRGSRATLALAAGLLCLALLSVGRGVPALAVQDPDAPQIVTEEAIVERVRE